VRAAGTPVRVQEYQISLIWTRTVPEKWRYRPRPGYGFLAREQAYRDVFLQAEASTGKPSGFTVPWVPQDRFWGRYAVRSDMTSRGELAWRWSLPLFREQKVELKLGSSQSGFSRWGLYLYPHGLTLVLRLRRRGDLPLAAAATQARELRYARPAWFEREVPLDQVASSVLATAGAEVWGSECRMASGSAEPFSVFTVIRASGTSWEKPVEEGGELHRFLDQVAGWYDRHRDPGSLAASRVSTERRDGHILYGHRRSRCVWFPEHYETEDVRFSLAHYHRNLTFASLQTESLGQYLCHAAEELGERGYLSIPEKAYAQHVVRSLERLRGGRPEETYRSRSPQRQMDDNDVTPSLERVKAYLAAQ
jgi:hypothetical protein